MKKMSKKIRIVSALCMGSFLGLLIAFIAPCQAHVQTRPPNPAIQKQIEALQEFKENIVIMPGQVSLLSFPYFGPFAFEQLRCNDQEIPFAAQNLRAVAYLVQSYFEKNTFACEFRFGESDNPASYVSLPVGVFTVNAYDYPAELLKVDQKKVVLSPEDRARADNEKQMLLKLYENSDKNLLFSDPFSVPLASKITSIYGTKRIFNSQVETQHLGTDFRAKVGTKIFASNSGKVVFTGDLFFGGNTVLIDHGLGIFTSYSHLSQIFAKVSEYVTKESLIGLSGMTGRVSGPHLHWGVNIHGNWVDGHSLVEASKKSFPATEQVSR